MAVSRAASAPVELAPMRPPTMAIVLTFGLIVVTLAYPPLLYDQGLARSLTSNGTLIFWAHTAVCAVGLLIAVALRATAFTSVQMFHWIFFVVAAREQFIHGWDGLYQLTDVVERGLLYVLLYEIVLLTVYLVNVGGRRGAFAPVAASTRMLAGHVRLTLLLVACFALDLVLLAHYGSSLFLSRYHFSTHSAQLFPAQFNLIFLQFIRPLLFFLPLFVLRSQLSWSKPQIGRAHV